MRNVRPASSAKESSMEFLKCAICGAKNETVSHELSRKTLIMGPFKGPNGLQPTYECRCSKCEKKLADRLCKMIDSIGH